MKVIFVSPENSTIWNFRADLITELIDLGHEVIATGPDHKYLSKIQSMGVRFLRIPTNKNSVNPFSDAKYALGLFRMFRAEQPDVVFCYTIKPNIYGSVAALMAGVSRRVAMVEGAGWAFMPSDTLRNAITAWIARNMYRIGLAGNHTVFFLNPDDLRMFAARHIVAPARAVLLDGIGINLDYFAYVKSDPTAIVRFVLVARLLRAKGVGEYVEAIRHLKEQGVDLECVLVGGVDPNPSSFSRSDIEQWEADGLLEYRGTVDDIRPVMGGCDVFVLPSYYAEGLPRTSLEAMATGRAIITTDMPGCRETVRLVSVEPEGDCGLMIGLNGILVPPKDPKRLAEAMRYMIDHPKMVCEMGRESRRYARERFDVRMVNRKIVDSLADNALETP